LENQSAAISFAKGLESTMSGEPIQEAALLLSRFTVLREYQSSNNLKCFIAQKHQDNAEHTVQLRIFSADDEDKESELLAFLLEARAAAQLSHPHIASSTNPEQWDDTHFYVTQHPPDAVTLRSRLDCRGWLDIEEAILIAGQILEALQYAHQSEIWHLKLQPEYIWINQDNHITLTDFGIPSTPSRPWAYQRRSQNCLLNYRNPEQLAGKLPDARSDVYGVGVLLYEMLTDALPFNAQDEKQLRHKIALKKAPPVHLIRPDIPESLSLIVAKLLSENPAERFQTVALAQAALNQFLKINWQAIEVRTTALAKVEEGAKAERTVQDEPDFKTWEFMGAAKPLPLNVDDPDAPINSAERALLHITQPIAQTSQALSPFDFEAQAVTHQQNSRVEAMTAPNSPTQEKPEIIGLPFVERLKRWEFLPFTLMTLGIVLLTAVSVLAVKSDFKNLFNPSSSANPSNGQTTSPAVEKSGLSHPQAQGATEMASGQEAAEQPTPENSATASGVPSDLSGSGSEEASKPSTSAPPLQSKNPSASRSYAPEVSRLRQQLRRVNEAKARNYHIRKSSSVARPHQPKPRKRFFKLRFWSLNME
jgi:serine/threonine protein kinase